jgi:hypothetical protein
MMTGEESGNVILSIFQRDCKKAGDKLSNKALHAAYFRKTDSGLGFQEGLKYVVGKKWVAAAEEENTHKITASGLRQDV